MKKKMEKCFTENQMGFHSGRFFFRSFHLVFTNWCCSCFFATFLFRDIIIRLYSRLHPIFVPLKLKTKKKRDRLHTYTHWSFWKMKVGLWLHSIGVDEEKRRVDKKKKKIHTHISLIPTWTEWYRGLWSVCLVSHTRHQANYLHMQKRFLLLVKMENGYQNAKATRKWDRLNNHEFQQRWWTIQL